MAFLRKQMWWKWFLSGVLLGVGFVYPITWPLGIVGAALYLHIIFRQTPSFKTILFGSWVVWTTKAAFSLAYIWTTYPIDWLPTELGQIQLFLIAGYWLVSAACLGGGGVIFGAGASQVKKISLWKPVAYSFLIPLLWVLSEVFGSLLYSIVTYGPGGSVNAYFSFSYAGYLLANQSFLLKAASVAGVYGLSFLFVIMALFFLQLITKKNYLVWPGVAAVCAIFIIVSLNNQTKSIATEQAHILIIDTQFSGLTLRNRDTTRSSHSELETAVARAISYQPTHILLPEDARFFDQNFSSSQNRSLFQIKYNNPSSVVVDTGYTQAGEKKYLQSYIYVGTNQPIEKAQKRYLVPQGEFVSTALLWILKVVGFGAVAEKTEESLSYEVGPLTNQSSLSAQIPGILFCFESVSPTGVRTLISERPDLPFVAHPISHSWFHSPESLWQQFDIMLKVQAVWNRQYIVSAGNQVVGKVYTPKGSIVIPVVIESGERWKLKEVYLPINK